MKFKYLLAIIFISIISSCGLKPIVPEHNLITVENNDKLISNLGNGKILLYNDANILHTADNTSKLNIIIDNKNLGQLRAKNYAIVKLKNGKHVFKIRHKDVVNMRSEHRVNITDSVKVIRVKPTITSNKLEIINKLPDNWNKYKYMNSN